MLNYDMTLKEILDRYSIDDTLAKIVAWEAINGDSPEADIRGKLTNTESYQDQMIAKTDVDKILGITDADFIRVDTIYDKSFWFEKVVTFRGGVRTTLFQYIKYNTLDMDVEDVSLKEAREWGEGRMLELRTSDGRCYEQITGIVLAKRVVYSA